MADDVHTKFKNDPIVENALEDYDKTNDDTNIKELLTEKAMNTFVHGIPNVQRSHSLARKIFWTLIVFFGFGITLWQISMAVENFMRYPTSTVITFESSNPLQFPAVTFCNLNPYRAGAVATQPVAAAIHERIVERQLEIKTDKDNQMRTKPVEDTSAFDFAEEKEEDYNFLDETMSLVSPLKQTDKLTLGHQLNTLLLSCTFAGVACIEDEFTLFTNPRYGNCYTYNHRQNNNSEPKEVHAIGPMSGLSMEFFIEQDQYIEGLADAAGLKVVVHNHTVMPFPEDDAFVVSPGTKTSIGIRQTHKVHAKEPYGTCKDYTNAENENLNAYLTHYNFVKTTQAACKKTCLQKKLMEECRCYSAAFPNNMDGVIKAYQDVEDVASLGSCTATVDKQDCETTLKSLYMNNTLGCHDLCPPPCEEYVFEGESTFGLWPSNVAQTKLMGEISAKSPYLWDIMNSPTDDPMDFIRDNVLKFEIFYNDIAMEEIITTPKYLIIDLVSNIGGQFGLWVGMSVIAIFDIFEFLVDVLIVWGKRCCSTNSVNSDAVVKINLNN